jgi:serine/threonine protein kinase
MVSIELERFRLQHLLGTGANYEVYAAVDSQTGGEVVVKRPWAQCLRGGQYRSIDELSARVIELHHRLGDAVPHLSALIGYTERKAHGRYFGDAFPQEYHVLVEERARGVPLVADIKDRFRGIPIGLGQNLFALYPLVPHRAAGAAGILQQLLDVEEAFTRRGCLVLDLRPQNVFFDPKTDEITVIDIGTFVDQSAIREARQAPDLHDCFAELCKFYMAPNSPPSHASGYREPFGMGPALGFSRDLERMIQGCRRQTTGALQDTAVGILQKINRREYGSVDAFRQDLQPYFTLVHERNRNLQDFPDLVEAWHQGMEMLREKYWRKFLFDPDADLVYYR